MSHPLKTRQRLRLLSSGLVAALLFSQYSWAKDLNGDEVKALLSGNTVEAIHAAKGFTITTYYSPDGTFRQIRDGNNESGTWEIDDQGFLCTYREGWGGECRLIRQEEGVWKAYKIPRNRMKLPRHKRTYTQVLEGNPHNL